MVNHFNYMHRGLTPSFIRKRTLCVTARYYNRRRSPAPTFSPGDMVYLDSEDIQTTRPSKKLSHRHLGPYPVERRVGRYAYRLVLPPPMRRLHPVFNVVKLSPAPDDPIVGTHHRHRNS